MTVHCYLPPATRPLAPPPPQISGTTVGEIRVVPSMHERKAIMFEEADAFIAIPGGAPACAPPVCSAWLQCSLHSAGRLPVQTARLCIGAELALASGSGHRRPACTCGAQRAEVVGGAPGLPQLSPP